MLSKLVFSVKVRYVIYIEMHTVNWQLLGIRTDLITETLQFFQLGLGNICIIQNKTLKYRNLDIQREVFLLCK